MRVGVYAAYRRDRDAEFAEPGPLPKEDLLARFDFAIAEAAPGRSRRSTPTGSARRRS